MSTTNAAVNQAMSTTNAVVNQTKYIMEIENFSDAPAPMSTTYVVVDRIQRNLSIKNFSRSRATSLNLTLPKRPDFEFKACALTKQSHSEVFTVSLACVAKKRRFNPTMFCWIIS